ncbi:MAG TPA: Calx-beta domain-containing protein, partial [Pseudobdellovibrionaceae bacterium]|nr:Calx-beta domain-containing protein [Pseudobdellovibrionaceae bacterium]
MSVFKAKLQTYKSFFYKSLSYSAFMLLIASCTFEASITKTGQSEKTNNIILKLDGSPISAEINEGSSILLLISQSKSRTVATPLSLTIRSNQSDIASVFPDAVLNSPNEGVLQFSVLPNQTFANISIYTLHNLSFTGHRVYTLSFSTSDEAIVNELSDINLTVKDLETTPLIGFASASSSYNENAGAESVVVSLSSSASESITVPFTISAGTATLGTDFSITPGTLTFAAGEVSKSISFNILEDVLVENGPAENFSIVLGTVTGPATLGTNIHTVNIIDNDTENFSISNVSANEGSNITFTVSLSNASLSNLSVDYATSNGTALSGTHYTSSTGTLNFIAGETSKNISISTIAIPSEICAADRSFTMTLSNAVGASVAISSVCSTNF